MFIFKIFDQTLNVDFDVNIIIVRNIFLKEDDEKLLSPYEMRIYFSIPTLDEASLMEISPVVYREIKRHDLYNVCQLETGYDGNGNYCVDIMAFQNDPIAFRKMFVNEGFKVRLGLHGETENQDAVDEYSTSFKDVKYLDALVEKFKACLKDASQAEVTLQSLTS